MAAFAEACLALTPKVAFYEPTGELFLDIAPTLKLFGGEVPLLLTVEELVDAFELDARQVLTDRPEWARALATKRYVEIPVGQSQERLNELPIERLMGCGDPIEISESAEVRQARRALIHFMRRVGLKQIGDFARLPPSSVGRRFGQPGVNLQEWVLGKRELSLPVFCPEEPIVENALTPEITSLDALLFLLRQLLIRIEARLQGRALVAREMKLIFRLASRRELVERFPFSEPLREATQVLRLLKEFLNRKTETWDSPLEELTLVVSETTPFTPGQLSLFDNGENRYASLAEYINRLRLRYGNTQVGFPKLRESYLPEHSWENVWPPVSEPVDKSPLPKRPLFLFTPARAFSPRPDWKLTPSENLDVEWWGEGGERRYFIARTPKGDRFWIYWDCHRKTWFLHGTFD